MVLAIDVGNTNIVVGCIYKEDDIRYVFRIATSLRKTEYEYAAQINAILSIHKVDLAEADGSIISSVVPTVTRSLRQAIRFLTGKEPMIIGAGVKTGLDIGLDDPGTIGPDLVATAVAVKNLYPLPCIIIDMGTATTITAVNEAGRYIGGAILPGAQISMNALNQNTSLLPDIEIVPPKKTIGTNTVECMKSGIVYGSAGAVDGIIDRFQKELGENTSIVATGGIASLICPYCRHDITIEKHLLLRGLAIIWKRNQPKKGGRRVRRTQ